MKKLLLAALLAFLTPYPALADSFQRGQISTAISTGTSTQAVNGVVGDCLSIVPAGASTPIFNLSCTGNVGVGGAYSPSVGGSTSYFPMNPTVYLANVGSGSVNDQPFYYTPTSFSVAGFTIGHIAVSCGVYNEADAISGQSPYNALDSTGLGGTTFTFGVINSTHSVNSPLILGQVVIPTSPQHGPFVTSGSAAVVTPYTVTPNTSLTLSMSGTDMSAAQQISQCVPLIGS